MTSILLTSTGISAPAIKDVFLAAVGAARSQQIVIIPNASADKKENKYIRLAVEQLSSEGFQRITVLDVTTDSLDSLRTADIVYVGGGNTFALLDALRRSGADTVITEKLRDPAVCYVGVSAGSLVVTPTIRLAAEVEPDPNNVGMEDFTGLGIYNMEVYPHYTPEIESELLAYEERHGVTVDRIKDDEAIFIDGMQIVRVS